MKKFLLALAVLAATTVGIGSPASAATPYPTYSDVCSSTTQTITTTKGEFNLLEVNYTTVYVTFKTPTVVRGTHNCIISINGQRNAGLVVDGDYNYVQAKDTRVTFTGNNNFVDSQGNNDVRCKLEPYESYVNYIHMAKRDSQLGCIVV